MGIEVINLPIAQAQAQVAARPKGGNNAGAQPAPTGNAAQGNSTAGNVDGATSTAAVSGSNAGLDAQNAAQGTQTPSGNQTTDTPSQTDEPEAGTPITPSSDFSPEALKQITNLSLSNRQLKKQIEALTNEKAQLTPAADVQAKLARLTELEEAMTSPRKWLALSKKTLEEVAEDVYKAADETAIDPRVDDLAKTIEAQKKELEALKAKDTERDTQQQTAQQQAAAAKLVTYTKTIVATDVKRWETIANNDAAILEAVRAADEIAIKEWPKDKQLTKADADKILQRCLDERESLELARQILEQRKKGGQSSDEPVQRKGIETRDEPRVDARVAPRPSVAIDDVRGPTRTGPTPERGPTDPRTARARMHRTLYGK